MSGGQVNRMMQLNFPCLIPDSHDRVFQLQQIFTLQLAELKANLFRQIDVIVIR